MCNLIFAQQPSIWGSDLWFALPAIIAISLVYAATRHEKMGPIFIHAGRMALWIVGFMFVVFLLLELVGRFA